jgi:hypothetical protein
MGYGVQGSMDYVPRFPANEVGGTSPPWDMQEYVLPGVWDKRESTVLSYTFMMRPLLRTYLKIFWPYPLPRGMSQQHLSPTLFKV